MALSKDIIRNGLKSAVELDRNCYHMGALNLELYLFYFVLFV